MLRWARPVVWMMKTRYALTVLVGKLHSRKIGNIKILTGLNWVRFRSYSGVWY